MEMKESSSKNLIEDSNNKKAHVSLRNLARSLNYIKKNASTYGLDRTLYDGLYLGLGSSLSRKSQIYFENQLEKILNISFVKYQLLLKNPLMKSNEFLNIHGVIKFLIKKIY